MPENDKIVKGNPPKITLCKTHTHHTNNFPVDFLLTITVCKKYRKWKKEQKFKVFSKKRKNVANLCQNPQKQPFFAVQL